jgi:hypothetical protein
VVRREGEYFRYSYGLVFTNRLFSFILSGMLLWFFERESLTLSTAPLYEYSFPSGAQRPPVLLLGRCLSIVGKLSCFLVCVQCRTC